MINLYESMGPGRDQPPEPWIYRQTSVVRHVTDCTTRPIDLWLWHAWSYSLISNVIPRCSCLQIYVSLKQFYQNYNKTCHKRPLKKNTKNWFSRPIIPQCRSKVLQNALLEHSAILSTFIKLPFVFKTFVLSIFEWPLKTGFTVLYYLLLRQSVTS